jgi:superfamily II DNA or RNA helicase
MPQPSVVLRPIQEHAIERVREAFAHGASAVLLQAATGYGKTLVACAIARLAVGRGNRVLFLAHQDILLRQMSGKLAEFGVPHGTIISGHRPNPAAPVQVASVQTMVRRVLKRRYDFELIAIDEAHRSVSPTYRAVLAAIPGARVLGITGTPQRLDGRGLGKQYGGLYDTLIATESVAQLVQLGYLVPPVYYASKAVLDLSQVKVRAGEYDSEELSQVVDTPVITGCAVTHYQQYAAGLPVLTWCITVKHAEHTAAQFNAAGIPTAVLSGKSRAEVRERVLARLARREILNVCFAQLLIEGVDVPAIRALIMLRPTKSLTAYLQVCGRGLRTDPKDASKKSCIILDHAGLAFTHGLCNEPRHWSLAGRPKGKRKERDTLQLTQCRSCFLIFELKDRTNDDCCPACDTPLERAREGPKTVDGELAEITEDAAGRVRRALARRHEVQRARTLPELEEIGRQRGYHPGWARIQFQEAQKARDRYGR